MKAIVWQITYRCNNKCPYCTIFGKYKGEPDIAYDLWLNAFNRLKPRIIDITGGEPFLYKDLIPLINGLNKSIEIGLTTNLTQDITQFVQKVNPSRILSMTLSYHPSMSMQKDYFIGKALLLLQRGFPINVNFVGYPEQMYMIPTLKYTFESAGIKFHVDPYAQHEGKQYEFNDFEQAFLKKMVGNDREFRFKETEGVVKCSAGSDYLVILPDGTAHRCMHFNLTGRKAIGNILDPTMKLYDEWQLCDQMNQCGGCDKDKTQMIEVKDGILT